MTQVKLFIDDNPVVIETGKTILEAGRPADIYIPPLRIHPELPNNLYKKIKNSCCNFVEQLIIF